MDSMTQPAPIEIPEVNQDSLDFVEQYADIPICHVFSQSHFCELLNTGANTLVLCMNWPDVMEGFGYSLPIPDKKDNPSLLASISDWKNSMYGQCWSLNPPSQYMLTTYSDTPVIVTSTVKDVFESVRDFAAKHKFPHMVKVGRIDYCKPEEMHVSEDFLESMTIPDCTVYSSFGNLLRKQTKYSFENEIRFLIDGKLYVNHPEKHKRQGLLKYDVSVAKLIHQVVLPSDAKHQDIERIKEAMIMKGLGGRFVVSPTLRFFS